MSMYSAPLESVPSSIPRIVFVVCAAHTRCFKRHRWIVFDSESNGNGFFLTVHCRRNMTKLGQKRSRQRLWNGVIISQCHSLNA